MITPTGHNPSQIPIGTLVLSSIILCLSIAGLIMQASGTPWISEAKSEGGDKVSYEAQDWEECCEDISDLVADTDEYSTFGAVFTSLTPYFVLLIIFSAVLAVISLVPIPRNFKGSLSSILGLSLLTTGIFLSRKFAISLSYYFTEISNLYGTGMSASPSFHFHVMVYFGGLVGLSAICAGWVIVNKNINSCNSLSTELLISRKHASGLLLIGLMVYLVSPLMPIYSSEFENESSALDETPSSELVFPIELLMVDDALAEISSDEENNLTAVSDYYSTAETLFLSLIWINLGILAVISMAIFPRANKYFETITQTNILSIGVIIPAIVFSILVYTGMPDIADDSSYVASTSFNANWVLILASVLCVLYWITMLVKSHIPWWASIAKFNNQLAMNNFNHSMQQQNQQPPRL